MKGRTLVGPSALSLSLFEKGLKGQLRFTTFSRLSAVANLKETWKTLERR